MPSKPRLAGMTLIEVMVVIAIVLVLAGLLLPNYQQFLGKADQVICTGKLRNLYLNFSTQLKEGNSWPQLPSSVTVGSIQEQQWWVDYASNSMGLTLRDWQCPSFIRLSTRSTNSEKSDIISYLPTLFDSSPTTPLNNMRMPWFTESGNFHHVGNLSIRADGSVSPAQQY